MVEYAEDVYKINARDTFAYILQSTQSFSFLCLTKNIWNYVFYYFLSRKSLNNILKFAQLPFFKSIYLKDSFILKEMSWISVHSYLSMATHNEK